MTEYRLNIKSLLLTWLLMSAYPVEINIYSANVDLNPDNTATKNKRITPNPYLSLKVEKNLSTDKKNPMCIKKVPGRFILIVPRSINIFASVIRVGYITYWITKKMPPTIPK